MARAKVSKEEFPIHVAEEDGLRTLHFGNECIQGAMRIGRPFALVLDYSNDMMVWEGAVDAHPRHIVQLGLGAASLTKYCWKHYPNARITAVEVAAEVVACAYQCFKLPRDARIHIEMADAAQWVAATRNRGVADVLQVDLYDQHALGPVYDSIAFYKHCRRTLMPRGWMTVNVFGDGWGFEDSFANVLEAFDGAVEALAPCAAGNRIILAQNL